MPEDFFALLQQPRRPWLDPDVLQTHFRQVSTTSHPDRFHAAPESERQQAGQAYARLNAAFQCLRDPRQRVLHLLKLETGRELDRLHQIPNELMEFFLQIGSACREADTMASDKATIVSPLLQVRWFQQSQELSTRLLAFQQRVHGLRTQLLDELIQLDNEWIKPKMPDQHETLALELERVARLLGFTDRWASQLRERVVRLAG